MDVTNAYMYTVKSRPQMFEAIQRAQVPPRFTHDFLRTLGFKAARHGAPARAGASRLDILAMLRLDMATAQRRSACRAHSAADGDGYRADWHIGACTAAR